MTEERKAIFANRFYDAIKCIRERLYDYEYKLDENNLRVNEIKPLIADLQQFNCYIEMFQGMEISNMEGEYKQLIRVILKLKKATEGLKEML